MADIERKLRGTSGPNRFWTFGGISTEMVPNVVSPLCWSVWEQSVDLAYRRALADFGVLSRRQVVFASDPNHQPAAPFFGRLAINVDATRELLGRIPGVSANEFERDMLGGVREDQPEERTAYARIPAILAKTPATMAGATGKVKRAYAVNRGWWESDVLDRSRRRAAPGDACAAAEAFARLRRARECFAETLYAHVEVRWLAQSARRAVMRLVERSGDPSLAASILGGYGETGDIAAADDIWRLAHQQIDIDEFLKRHGFRGTHEGNVYARSWREDPSRIESLAAAYRRRPDAPRPGASERAAVERRLAAELALISGLPRLRRPLARWLLSRAANIVRTVQLGRAAYLMALDGCRAAARDLGAELAAGGTFSEVDDVFFLTEEELSMVVCGSLPDVGEIVARRRVTRKEYETLELPSTFTGLPTPVPVAAESTADPADTSITGTPGNGGVAEGRARVVLDPHQDSDLDEGDILVCAATDPSWTALLALAAGAVIDNGGETSHGAIVSRELGIPCVIGTGNGTSRIPNGAWIRVDGDAATVTVLSDR